MLLFLLACVVAFILLQQALTLRYVALRPELAILHKNTGPGSKHWCCWDKVYTTFNYRRPVNYIYLSVIVAESPNG